MPCGTVWSGWIGFGSVRSAMSMRILNVGGSAGQPPLVFLTRMPGIRAAHPLLFPFSPPSHHNSQAFLPPSPSYRFPPYRSRVPSCFTIDRLLHVYVSPFSLSSIANSVSESVSKNHFFFFCLLDQSFHPYFSCVFPRAMDRLYLEMIFYYRYHDWKLDSSSWLEGEEEEDKRRREDGPKAKFHWMRRGVERWFSYSPEDVLMSRGRQEERLPRWELFFCYSRASAFLGKIGACNRSLSNALLREEGLIIIDQDLLSFYVSRFSAKLFGQLHLENLYGVWSTCFHRCSRIEGWM